MKYVKTLTALMVTALIIALCVPALAETYMSEAVVVEKHVVFDNEWMMTAINADGNVFSWYDDASEEYWHIGDLVILEMFDTGVVETDEVLDVILIGTLSPVDMVHWLEN